MDWHGMVDIVTDVITAGAAIAAIIGGRFAYTTWKQEKQELQRQERDRQEAYLHIEVNADLKYEGFLTVMTVVENKGMGRKKLKNAVLLIGLEDEDPRETVRKIGIPVEYTNDIVKHDPLDGIESGPEGRYLIPLDFYYSENVWIADEKMSYRAPISTQGMKRGVPYSVRFFIGTPGRLHRSTQDCFILPKGDGG